MNISFPPRLHLVAHRTPFHCLERINKALGPDAPKIWMKRDDLTGLLVSGNKVRKLEFILAKARASGVCTLITCGGVQSNHCRATAVLGTQLGFKVHLVLRGPEESHCTGNQLISSLMGAEVDIHPPITYRKNLNQLLEDLKVHYDGLGRKALVIPTGASDGMGIWGYLAAYGEIQQDCHAAGIRPEFIVTASGSGGTQAGLTLGNHLADAATTVIGMAVCDDEKYFKNKVLQDISEWELETRTVIDKSQLNIVVNDRYIGPGYAKADKAVYDCIRWVAKTEGILLDPVYTGKAFFGLLEEIQQGRFLGAKNIVFVHTGGVFGIFSDTHLSNW